MPSNFINPIGHPQFNALAPQWITPSAPYCPPQHPTLFNRQPSCAANLWQLSPNLSNSNDWTCIQPAAKHQAKIYFANALKDPVAISDNTVKVLTQKAGELHRAVATACKRLHLPDAQQAKINIAILPKTYFMDAAKELGYTTQRTIPLVLRQPNGTILINSNILLQKQPPSIQTFNLRILAPLEIAVMTNLMMETPEAQDMLWLPNTKAPNWGAAVPYDNPKEIAGDFLFRMIENPNNPVFPEHRVLAQAFSQFIKFFNPELKILLNNPNWQSAKQAQTQEMTYNLLAPFTLIQAAHLLEYQLGNMGISDYCVLAHIDKIDYGRGMEFMRGGGFMAFERDAKKTGQNSASIQLNFNLYHALKQELFYKPCLLIMHELAHTLVVHASRMGMVTMAHNILKKPKNFSPEELNCLKLIHEGKHMHSIEFLPDALIYKLTGINRFSSESRHAALKNNQVQLKLESYETAFNTIRHMPKQDFNRFVSILMSDIWLGYNPDGFSGHELSLLFELLGIYTEACKKAEVAEQY